MCDAPLCVIMTDISYLHPARGAQHEGGGPDVWGEAGRAERLGSRGGDHWEGEDAEHPGGQVVTWILVSSQ